MMMVMVMFVGLLMALIIFMNSLADVRLSTMQEQSERAFNASEAGIEHLLSLSNLDGETADETTVGLPVDVDMNAITQGVSTYEYKISNNDTGEIQLKGATDTSIEIFWSIDNPTENPGTCGVNGKAGLIVEKWNNNGAGVISVDRRTFQALGCSVISTVAGSQGDFYVGGTTWAFSGPGGTPASVSYISNTTVPIDIDDTALPTDSFDFMIRVRPIFNDATVYAEGNNTKQKYRITSSSQLTTTGESRALEVVRMEPQLPSIFDYVLFSGQDAIVKE